MEKMRFQVASDTHLEFLGLDKKKDFLELLLDHNECNNVIIAGDIGAFRDYDLLCKYANQYNKKCYIVAGNHDYYNSSINDNVFASISNCENIKILTCDNILESENGIKVAGDTMWTALPGGYDPSRYVNDIKCIIDFDRLSWIQLHNRFLYCLEKKWKDENIDVIVSHHMPHIRSVAYRFYNNISNLCFYSNVLTEERSYMKLWVHGHTHDSFDYVINNTRVVCNPYGYRGENVNFDFRKFVEVS